MCLRTAVVSAFSRNFALDRRFALAIGDSSSYNSLRWISMMIRSADKGVTGAAYTVLPAMEALSKATKDLSGPS